MTDAAEAPARPARRRAGSGKRRTDLAALEARLGHGFADPDLLRRALTHVSAGAAGSYQRLEFLGDRVLGLAVAGLLYRTFPDDTEGDLSRRLSELVRKETCAAVAEGWEVAPYLRFGVGGGNMRLNRSVLGDVCEAIIGAVFVDAGFEAAAALVERGFGQRLGSFAAPPSNPKAALQEWALGRGLPTPVYRVVEQRGPDHAPQFRMAVAVPGVAEAEGHGASKRVAEQAAARAWLGAQGLARPEEGSGHG